MPKCEASQCSGVAPIGRFFCDVHTNPASEAYARLERARAPWPHIAVLGAHPDDRVENAQEE